jgi:hypothetical protein
MYCARNPRKKPSTRYVRLKSGMLPIAYNNSRNFSTNIDVTNRQLAANSLDRSELPTVEKSTPATILFIDYENITQVRLSTIKRSNLKIFIFVGCVQDKIPFELVREAHQLGESVEWIGVEGIGPNALDFHIVFYLGQMSLLFPTSNYLILSGDRGFDPLLQHLHKLGISCKRINSLDVLSHESDLIYNPDFLAELVLEKLSNTSSKSRPKTKPALHEYSKSMLAKYQLSELAVEGILDLLFATEKIIKSQGKIVYKF